MDYEFLTIDDQDALVEDQLRNLEREHFQLTVSLPAGLDPDHPASIRLREVEQRIISVKTKKTATVRKVTKRAAKR